MTKINTYDIYIAELLEKKLPLLLEMESYAEERHIPIMDSNSIEAFLGLLTIQNPLKVLEIGSAIGYSAIRIAQLLPEAVITTIEQDSDRFLKAVEFIKEAGLEERVHIIEADALESTADVVLAESYDALFIDAAKGQYTRFFDKYSSVVKVGGVIYCDNMFMHGLVLKDNVNIPRRKRTMIRNIKMFTKFIMENSSYKTTLLPIGDGILIAKKVMQE